MLRCAALLALASAFLFSAVPADAHPHVFVTVKSTVVYENGALKAVKHAWRFDDMFSAFAVQGLDTDTDGKLSKDELQALAEVNVTSLKEFDFFTFGEAGGNGVSFNQPVDYWLDYDGTALTLNFTLPVSSAHTASTVRLEIYDPTYFVSFSLADDKPATLEGAPEDCRIDAEGPDDEKPSAALTEKFFSNLDPNEAWGKQFANVLTVRCGADAVTYAASIAPPPPPPDPLARVETALNIAKDTPLQEMPPAVAKPPAAGPQLGAFGLVRPDGAFVRTPTNGPLAWITQQQAAFYAKMSKALTATKADNSALLLLIALSFAYGVFHAAGPGHGKAVISSYLLATGETLRRGIAISFASALAQAVTAVAIVGTLAIALGATSQAMGIAAWWLEAGSYALIVLLGIAILFRRSLIPLRGKTHVHDENCDHSHGPELKDLDGEFGWRRAGAAILAVGLRPCTGALIVLVFALAQGLIWTGVAATFAMALGTAVTVAAIATFAVLAKGAALKLAGGSSKTRTRKALRMIEVAAGFAVLAFGLILLGGMIQAGVPTTAVG
jgi:ABC-type nickel/cobalt efflux system permease component RcnA/ABC-type uncharacterized transport system substrate-binding protein